MCVRRDGFTNLPPSKAKQTQKAVPTHAGSHGIHPSALTLPSLLQMPPLFTAPLKQSHAVLKEQKGCSAADCRVKPFLSLRIHPNSGISLADTLFCSVSGLSFTSLVHLRPYRGLSFGRGLFPLFPT